MTLTASYFENVVDMQITTYSGHAISVYKFVSAAADIYQQGLRVWTQPLTVYGHYVRSPTPLDAGNRNSAAEIPDGSGAKNEELAFVVFSLPELRRKFPLAAEFTWIDNRDLISIFGTQYSVVGTEYTGFMYAGTKVLKLDLMEFPDTVQLYVPEEGD